MSQSSSLLRADQPLLLLGEKVGLALCRENVPAIARWNQDLEFTANIGTPEEAHTQEMRPGRPAPSASIASSPQPLRHQGGGERLQPTRDELL
jgi:hypothetical protein